MLKICLLVDYLEAYDHTKMFEIDGLVRLERHASLYYWKSEYVLKLWGTMYEMNMIYLAGSCAIPVLGGAFRGEQLLGFVMKREKSLANEVCLSNRVSKRSVMDMMKDVVEELHKKGIVHGDIKLDNMLLCSDGRVRLCDFAGAILISQPNPPPSIYTDAYISAYRSLHPREPFTIYDDLFALGVTIWELFTGKMPF